MRLDWRIGEGLLRHASHHFVGIWSLLWVEKRFLLLFLVVKLNLLLLHHQDLFFWVCRDYLLLQLLLVNHVFYGFLHFYCIWHLRYSDLCVCTAAHRTNWSLWLLRQLSLLDQLSGIWNAPLILRSWLSLGLIIALFWGDWDLHVVKRTRWLLSFRENYWSFTVPWLTWLGIFIDGVSLSCCVSYLFTLLFLYFVELCLWSFI